MIECLTEHYASLVVIRKYLVKKGQCRYSGKIIENKLNEASIIFSKCEEIILLIKKGNDSSLIISAVDIFQKISTVFEEINNLCTFPKTNFTKMEFDIKVACSLIPAMDGVEETTQRMIDSIEMYGDMIDDKGRVLLITFVLKSRLSRNAKLRIANSYKTVGDLVKDLRNNLLPKKSFTAIQTQLQNVKQGSKSIDEYGTEIEKLFTDLTIAQAEDDPIAFEVLKPRNEKLALKKFSDGLRSSRLGTIITARNYSSLKDAIQAAKDEELSSFPSQSGNVMHFTKNRRISYNVSSSRGYQQQSNRGEQRVRGYNRGQHNGNYFRGQMRRTTFNNNTSQHFNYVPGYSRGQRGSMNRGMRYFHNRGAARKVFSGEQHIATPNNNNKEDTEQTLNQFFRG